ncbi:MAG: NAD(P)/FAD-dependent oxidoreductase [Desulfatitalea sp.]|nr:FAD-binding protein [Desulfatitalea sp.]NNK02348.1 NAD(P)/FAD-dependent oxidoreductase [Desulfatitalea sp.]
MTEKLSFDVVVIGSGMGGMCVGARLAHKGYKTLLVERLDRLGGRCSTVEVEGFQKSTGAILTAGNSVVEDTFKEVGAEFDVRKPDPPCVWRINGENHVWPVHEGLMHVIHLCSQDKAGAGRLLQALQRAIEWQIPIGDITLYDWILQFTQDENIIKSFAPLLQGWLCLNIKEIPAVEFCKFMRYQIARPWEVVLPAKGNQETFMMPLANVIEKKGGQIWKRVEAGKILVEDHKVTGVVLKTPDGDLQISAQAVVSNMGPKKTVELTGEQYFDKAYLKKLATIRPVPFFLDICAVSDEPMTEYPGAIMTVGANKLCAAISHSMTCPDVAPAGKHILNAYAAMPKPVTGPIDEEKEMKEAVEELKAFVPGVAEKGRILSIDIYQGEWPIFHSVPTTEFPQKTSIKDLYNVGDGVRISEFTGTTLAAETARVVAEDIQMRISPSK